MPCDSHQPLTLCGYFQRINGYIGITTVDLQTRCLVQGSKRGRSSLRWRCCVSSTASSDTSSNVAGTS